MTKRSLLFVFFISLITLGFYSLYWLIITKNEMIKKGAKIPTILLPLLPLLGLIVVVLLQLISLQMIKNSGDSPNPAANILNIISFAVGSLCFIAVILLSIYWFYKYSQGVAYVTGNRLSTAVCFWSGMVCSLFSILFIWQVIVQKSFNETDASPIDVPQAPTPLGPSPSPIQ